VGGSSTAGPSCRALGVAGEQRQHETDLAFVRRLAQRNGYVFYVEPATFGVNRAYFGPEIRTAAPQSALTMNMGARTNVERLSFSNDALAPVGTTGTFVDPIFKLPIPIPQLPSLRIPPLSSSPSPSLRTVQLRESANESAATAATAAVAAVTRTPEPIEAHGEVDETIPLAAVLDWARPQELPVVVVPGADHFFHRKLQPLRSIVESNWK
jgi:hypothetical protein